MTDTNVLTLRPLKASSCEVSRQRGNHVVRQYVVCCEDKYIRLSEPLYRMFDLMDGSESVAGILDRVFVDGGRPSESMVVEFLAALHRNGMITGTAQHDRETLQLLAGKDAEESESPLSKIGRKILRSKIAFKNADRTVTWLFNTGGKYIFSPLALNVIVLLCLVGAIFFLIQIPNTVATWDMGKLVPVENSLALGLLTIYVTVAFTMIIHELGHALTCKYFGRKVSALGFMLYYGGPACFTDTTDCWMLPKKKRVAVDAAGIIANVMLGSLFAILMPLFSSQTMIQICTIGALTNYVGALVNLIPFLKFDGYYILADLLDRPSLRDDAFELLLNLGSWSSLLRDRGNRLKTVVTLAFGFCSLACGGVFVVSMAAVVFDLLRLFTAQSYGSIVAYAGAGLVLLTVISYAIDNAKKYRSRAVSRSRSKAKLSARESGKATI